jgi:CheY-like chemotaxis protein
MKILVADDSTTIQKVIQLAFEGQNSDLVFVTSFIEVLSEVTKTQYGAIICDASLSGLSTDDDFKKLKQSVGQTPIIILKGSFDNTDEDLLKAAGLAKILQKPFEASQIVSMVTEATGGANTPSFSLDESSTDAAANEIKQHEEQFGGGFSVSEPATTAQKGQKAFEPEDLSLSSMEDLSMAGREETSPALNLDLMDVNDDTTGATILESEPIKIGVGTPEPVTPPKPPVSQAAPAVNPSEIDLKAVAAQLMPTIKEQIHNEMRLYLKEHIGQKMDSVVREVLREELHKLMDQKNSLFNDQ